MVFDNHDAIKLRLHRLICHRVEITQKNVNAPCIIGHYSARIAFEKDICNFMILSERLSPKLLKKESWISKLDQIRQTTKDEYYKTRSEELIKRGVEPTDERIGFWDETKLKIPVGFMPMDEISNYEIISMSKCDTEKVFQVNDDRMILYRDLFERGFYLTAAMKFGGDFLAYQGDPVMYHGTFVACLTAGRDGNVDLTEENYLKLNTIFRLCHSSNKIPLFAVVYHFEGETKIRYWILRTKRYIQPDKSNNFLEEIVPKIDEKYILVEDETSIEEGCSKRIKIEI